MAFNPQGIIRLCHVDFDNTYKNQIFFKNESEQIKYFTDNTRSTLTNYLTIRRTTSGGGLESRIKVDMNIDLLQSMSINYMFYQNQHHGDKRFYAFITSMVYINENTTELIFETDVWQTWMFNIDIMDSYVVREHCVTDEIGDNVVPERFNIQEYTLTDMDVDCGLDKWGYLVASTNSIFAGTKRGGQFCGIYQGLYFYYYYDEDSMNEFLNQIETAHGDCIVFIAVLPEFNISNSKISIYVDGEPSDDEGVVWQTNKPPSKDITFDMDDYSSYFGGYTPKNNKLHTYPYESIIVTNHNGNQTEYKIEDFNKREITFKMYGDICANPSITMYPLNYQGVYKNYDCGISITGFPQCAFNSDTYKLWLAKNQFGVGVDVASNVLQVVGGVAGTVATGGIGGVLGSGMIASGVGGILSTWNEVKKASMEPNKLHSGSCGNNLLTAIGFNKFSFYHQKIKMQHAIAIDDFFTMYGYQTNRVKTPNLSSRPKFNYIETVDINITGGIPCDDMNRIKQMFNSGVTLWKPDATIGDYTVNNKPA